MSLEGYIDSCQGGRISGWVWNREQPDQRQVLEISLDNTPLCRITAEDYRKDLQDAGSR